MTEVSLCFDPLRQGFEENLGLTLGEKLNFNPNHSIFLCSIWPVYLELTLFASFYINVTLLLCELGGIVSFILQMGKQRQQAVYRSSLFIIIAKDCHCPLGNLLCHLRGTVRYIHKATH